MDFYGRKLVLRPFLELIIFLIRFLLGKLGRDSSGMGQKFFAGEFQKIIQKSIPSPDSAGVLLRLISAFHARRLAL